MQSLTATEQLRAQIAQGNRVIILRAFSGGRLVDQGEYDLTVSSMTDREWVIDRFHRNNPVLHYYGEGKNTQATEDSIQRKVDILAQHPTSLVYFVNFGDGYVALTAEQYHARAK